MDWSILMAVITMPFSFNAFGQVNTTTDPRKLWRDRALLVLLTRFNEKLMAPSFGSDLGSTLFESAEQAAEIAVKTITIAFNQWLSSLKLKNISPEYNYETGSLEVTILYSLPSGETDTVTVNTAVFNRSGDLLLEITNG
jgi:phage baseplate assembly protein W